MVRDASLAGPSLGLTRRVLGLAVAANEADAAAGGRCFRLSGEGFFEAPRALLEDDHIAEETSPGLKMPPDLLDVGLHALSPSDRVTAEDLSFWQRPVVGQVI